MISQIVVGVRADERDQIRDGFERVEVLVLAKERLPFIAGVAPPRCPQSE